MYGNVIIKTVLATINSLVHSLPCSSAEEARGHQCAGGGHVEFCHPAVRAGDPGGALR